MLCITTKLVLDEPSPSVDQVYLSCTQKDGKVDVRIVPKNRNSSQGSPPPLISNRCTKARTSSKPGATIWKVTLENALNAAVNQLLNKTSSSCLDDQINAENLETDGEMSGTCSQIVFL